MKSVKYKNKMKTESENMISKLLMVVVTIIQMARVA